MTFILHKYFSFLNLFTHLFYMSVHFNTFMQGRHKLQVFPSASWIVQYCPWSCLDVSSCFSLLWTYRILDEYNWVCTTDSAIVHYVSAIDSVAPFWFMYAAVCSYKISSVLCLHKFSFVAHTLSLASHIVHCCCYFL
jgi:hypothetical protein